MEKFVILAAGLAWLLAQALKSLIARRKHGRVGVVDAFTATGGMPSSHAAFVTGLTVAIFASGGLSLAFVLSLALAILTLRDALGVRKTVDHHAHALNRLMAVQDADLPPLPTNAGHHPKEVLCGVAIGLCSALLLTQTPIFQGGLHALRS